MELNARYWNNRYINKDTGWDLGGVSTPLVEYVDQLKTRELRVLMPGAGNAYDAMYLYESGFKNTEVLDFAKMPLESFASRFPTFPTDQLIRDDFFNHQGTYDLILEQTFFCALSPTLRKDYAKHMSDLLHDKGRLVGVLFDFEFGGEEPPFGGSKTEYIEYFRPYFEICTMAPCYNSIEPRKGMELFINLRKR